jgi:signal peptidase II
MSTGSGTGTDTPAASTPRGTASPYVVTLVGVAGFVLTADAVSKAIVVSHLSGHAPIRLLGGLLTLRLLRNSGAAFSIGTSMTFVFTAIALGVIIFILRTARKLRSLRWAITFGLLLGGATGNLADRLFRAPAPLRGSVVDWIELPHWPVFNLADSAIVCGGVLAVLLAVLGLRLDGTKPAESASPPGPSSSAGSAGQPGEPCQAGEPSQTG